MNHRSVGLRPKILALIAAIVAVAGIACGDLTGVPASLPTLADSTVVYAINGAPPGAPTAYRETAQHIVRNQDDCGDGK